MADFIEHVTIPCAVYLIGQMAVREMECGPGSGIRVCLCVGKKSVLMGEGVTYRSSRVIGGGGGGSVSPKIGSPRDREFNPSFERNVPKV